METDKSRAGKEKIEKEKEESIVGSVVGQLIPGLGRIVSTLEKSSPEFRKRIAGTDSEIQHRLEAGWDSKPKIRHGVSIRPLSRQKGAQEHEETRIEEPEPVIDVFEEKDYISVIAELPGIEEKDIKTRLTGDFLEIGGGERRKTIKLPSPAKSIIERTYKNGVLQLKIERKGNAG